MATYDLLSACESILAARNDVVTNLEWRGLALAIKMNAEDPGRLLDAAKTLLRAKRADALTSGTWRSFCGAVRQMWREAN